MCFFHKVTPEIRDPTKAVKVKAVVVSRGRYVYLPKYTASHPRID